MTKTPTTAPKLPETRQPRGRLPHIEFNVRYPGKGNLRVALVAPFTERGISAVEKWVGALREHL